MTAWLVTRHRGAEEWVRRRGIAAELTETFNPHRMSAGDIVIGTLPVHLAAEVCHRGGRYLHLAMTLPREARGIELSADDMDRYGARLEEYRIEQVGAD